MILGMTASRYGLTEAQRRWLAETVWRSRVLHHGACVGGDETGHDFAVVRGLSVVLHPPLHDRYMMPREKFVGPNIEVREPKWYHDRNRDIVHECEFLVGLPDGPEREGSGTWYTINYAAEVGRTGLVCYPDGSVVPLENRDARR